MKYLKKYNESKDWIKEGELFLTGKKRYTKIFYQYMSGKMVVKASEDGVISFQTDEQGVDIYDINQLEDLIEFLMYHRDKSI